MNRRHDDNGICRYIKLWPIVLAIVALVSSFALMKNAVAQNTKDVMQNRVEHKEIFQRLDRVETVIEMIPEMRQDIKTLLKGDKNGK